MEERERLEVTSGCGWRGKGGEREIRGNFRVWMEG